MTKMINYGVLGCGMMGQEHLRNIAHLEGARVAAIFDPDAGMASQAQAIAPDAVMCASLEDLLDAPDLDCLLVVSPNHLHAAQFKTIAERRPLPLLIEKPLFTDSQDVALIAKLEAEYPAPVWVAMEYRYMPPVQKMIAELKEATGGPTMVTIREHRFPFLEKVGDWNRHNEKTGGTLVEKCCHFFDLMRLMLKSDPVRVMASGGQDVNHLDEVYDGKKSDIWDAAFVIVDFANGTRAMLELCMYAEGSRFQEEITAVGPKGKIEAKVPGPGRFWPAELGDPPVAEVIISPRDPAGPRSIDIPVDPELLSIGDHNGSTFYQHERFLDVVRGNSAPEVTVSDGTWAVRIGQAAQQSAITGQAVSF